MNRRAFLSAATALVVPHQSFAMASDPVGLIFIAQSSCPYCAVLSPLLFDLSNRGMSVLPVSMDYAPVAPFATFEDGWAHPISASITSVPHVLVYHSVHDRITHEVSGFRSLRHFVTRLSRALDEARSF